MRSRTASTGSRSRPTACTSSPRTASRSSSSTTPASTPRSPTTSTARAGAEIVDDAADVWGRAGMVLKVKEPQDDEFDHLRPGLVLFTYLHLAAYPEVADALLEHEVTGDRVRDGAAGRPERSRCSRR